MSRKRLKIKVLKKSCFFENGTSWLRDIFRLLIYYSMQQINPFLVLFLGLALDMNRYLSITGLRLIWGGRKMEVLEIKAGARTVKMFCGFFRQKKLLGFFRELVSNHLTATLVQAKRRIERGRESEIKCVRA